MRKFWLTARVRARQQGRLGARVIDLNGQHGGPAEAVSVKGLRVLLIDDNDATRDLLTGTLRHYEAEVTAVASAQAAMQLLDQVRPQVLVSNCAMDDAEACSLIRRVRAIETQHNRRIPTVALQARVGTGRLISHRAVGFQVHVPEPPTPHELVSLIGKLGMAGCSLP